MASEMLSEKEIRYWQFHDCIRNSIRKSFSLLEGNDVAMMTDSVAKWWLRGNKYSDEEIEMIADNAFKRMKLKTNNKFYTWIPKDDVIMHMKKDITDCLRQNNLMLKK